MHHYRLIPDNGDVLEFVGPNPATALNVAQRANVNCGDVYEGQNYLFSFQCDESSCWIIEGTCHHPERAQDDGKKRQSRS